MANTRRSVYNALIHRRVWNNEEDQEELLTWLRSNNIDPEDVPMQSSIIIETSPSGRRWIHHTVYVKERSGHNYKKLMDGSILQEDREVLMMVDLPHRWYLGSGTLETLEQGFDDLPLYRGGIPEHRS